MQFRPSSAHDGGVTTTNAGAPVWNDNEALTVGPRGPILLEDYHLIEKVAHFARERIPERVVHARGASAKGFFECTPGFKISVEFRRNFGKFFVFASYREEKFRYFSVFFIFKFKNSKIFIKKSKKI